MNGNLLERPSRRDRTPRSLFRGRARKRPMRLVVRAGCLVVALAAIGAVGIELADVARRTAAGEITPADYFGLRWRELWQADGDKDVPRDEGIALPSSPTPPYDTLYAYDADAIPAGARAVIPVNAYADATFSWQGEWRFPQTLPEADAPRVLIVHAHAGEGYTPEGTRYFERETEVGRADGATEASVVALGARLAEELNAGGLAAIHIAESFDAQGNAGAFSRAAERVKALLSEYPSLFLVIDLHRAAGMDEAGNILRHVTWYDGRPTAQSAILYAPFDEDSATAAAALADAVNEEGASLCGAPVPSNTDAWSVPDVCRLRIEVGTAGNSPEEAASAVDALARALLRFS